MDKSKRFLELGWRLLEHKYRYYILCRPEIQDHEFDALEAEYRALASDLGRAPSASDMVDFDMSRPSCQLVAGKIGGVAKKSLAKCRKRK